MAVTIECYTTTRPEHPWRALVVAIALLVSTSLLAAGMSWKRSAQLLGPRIQSRELGVSFRPPRGFREGDVVQTRRGPAHPFHGKAANGAELLLAIRRMEVADGERITEVCERLLTEMGGRISQWMRPFSRRPVRAAESTLGGLSAIEAIDEYTHTILRIVLYPEGFATAITLTADRIGFDEVTYRQFDRVCASVQFAEE